MRGVANPSDQGQDFIIVEGLGDVMVRPELHRLHRRGHILDRRDHDHFDVRIPVLDLFEHLKAVEIGEQ